MYLSLSSFATHIIGGDFQVTQTGANTFFVTLTVFRDCNPGNASSVTIGSVDVRDNVTNNIVQTLFNWTGPVTNNPPIGDNCFDPTVWGICVEKRIFTKTFTLSNNPNGYYLAWDICCRNGTVANLDVGSPSSPSEGSTFYVQIPDPALWNGTSGNSTPDFGDYPVDGYFCISSDSSDADIKDFSVTDADGDDLKYYLINPYNDGTTSKPFNLVPWQPGHSLANILGNFSPGYQPMSIDVNTGIITAFPQTQGLYAFAVLVEEWRNGVKIGETVRDLQYQAINCSSSTPPLISIEDSVAVYVDDQICFDIQVTTSNSTDSVYLYINSPNFDLQGNFVQPNIGANASSYSDWLGISNNTLGFTNLGVDTNMIGPGDAIVGLGIIPLRYCWTPECEDLDSVFLLDLMGVVIDTCGNGIDTTTIYGDPVSVLYSQAQSEIHVVYDPPPTLLNAPNDTLIDYGDELCISIYAEDSVNINDTLFIQPYSDSVNWLQYFEMPLINSSGDYYYPDFLGDGNDFTMTGYLFNGFNPSAIGKVGVKFCVPADCYAIDLGEYNFTYQAVSTGCGALPVIQSSKIEFNNPDTEEPILPNVFNPNSTAGNHVYKIKGTNDPCNEFMSVTIYNRWGKKVFESEDPYFQWDGTHYKNGNKCKAGTYYVVINGEFGGYDDAGERKYYKVIDQKYINLVR